MYSLVPIIAAATVSPPPAGRILLWTLAAVATLLFVLLLLSTKFYWRSQPARTIAVARTEKACDGVLGICALLIPATLGLITWLQEKVGPGVYLVPLAFAFFYFLVLLVFTVYLRFNFLWSHDRRFEVDSTRNMAFPYWVTTAMSAIVLGTVLLAIPILALGSGWLTLRDKDSTNTQQQPVECKVTVSAPPSPVCPAPEPCVKKHKNKHKGQHK